MDSHCGVRVINKPRLLINEEIVLVIFLLGQWVVWWVGLEEKCNTVTRQLVHFLHRNSWDWPEQIFGMEPRCFLFKVHQKFLKNHFDIQGHVCNGRRGKIPRQLPQWLRKWLWNYGKSRLEWYLIHQTWIIEKNTTKNRTGIEHLILRIHNWALELEN